MTPVLPGNPLLLPMKITLNNEELATVLASLRYWQEQGLADNPSARSDAIHDIATAGDQLTSLTGESIDALCQRLNGYSEEGPAIGELATIEDLERAHISAITSRVENLDHAARILGIDIATLYRKRVRYKMPLRMSGPKR